MSHCLHVADACASTGKVLEQHVVNVSLSMRLEPKGNPSKEYTDHVVMLFTNCDSQHPLLVGTIRVKEFAKSHLAKLAVRITPRPPTLLIAKWYASAYDKQDEIRAQELIASGSFAVGETSSIRLVDIENTVQGTLHVTGWPFDPPVTQRPVNKQAQTLIQQVVDSFDRVTPAMGRNDRFSEVKLHLGDRVSVMPLVIYPLHATQMCADPVQVTAYFEHALRVCDGGKVMSAQLLADVVTLPSLGWIYRPDVTRTGEDADQWASIHAAPGGAPLAFDCEDGTKALMEIVHVLQTTRLVNPSPLLDALQRLAMRFVCYFVIVELKSADGSARKSGLGGGDKYINHAMALLLRRDPLDIYLEPVTLESTSYCSGAWPPSVMRTLAADEKAFAMVTHKADSSLDAVQSYNMRAKSPVSMVIDQKMYNRTLSLISCSAGPNMDQTHHILLNVSLTEFLVLNGGALDRVKHVMAIDMPTAQLREMLRAELELIPACRFPCVPSSIAAAAPMRKGEFLMPPGSVHARSMLAAITRRLPITSDMTLYESL